MDYTAKTNKTPEKPFDFKINPRPVKFNITRLSPQYWFDNDPFKSHFFNAFFTTFPAGESFFVRSVQAYRHLIHDDILQQEINDFSTQEGNHSHAHDLHADVLISQGYKSIERDNKILDWGLHTLNRFMPRFSLAVTIAIEHFTAILSHQVYATPELFINPIHEDFQPMFLWHAAEEIEHKGVAFDAYQAVDGSYIQRNIAMAITTIAILLLIFVRIIPLLRKDGLALDRKTWRGGLSFMFGKQGLFTLVFGHYKQFYRRDFHPWDVQDYAMTEVFRRDYDNGAFIANIPEPAVS
ncbi:MAG: metal-dependent hydrolase [Gammaproteobacteria bacterium]|nr:metal-dependent hydrolase [Gammaproteobacteria bacterium]